MDSIQLNKECTSFSNLFTSIIADLKNSNIVWEDLINKCTKFHSSIKAMLLCSAAFLEAFQKVADLATNSQGAAVEIGATLTRLCMRQRVVETKLKTLNHELMASLATPLQDRLEDWRKTTVQLDKDRLRDTKKAKADYKKAATESIRLQKKAGKVRAPSSVQTQVQLAVHGMEEKYRQMEDCERAALRKAFTEERSRFCFFIQALQPVLECQLGLLGEISSVEELTNVLKRLSADPHKLPTESEFKLTSMSHSTNHSDPLNSTGSVTTLSSQSSGSAEQGGSMGSRKSSATSINSAPFPGMVSTSGHMQTESMRNSYQDSGFVSQDTVYMKSGFAIRSSKDGPSPSTPLASINADLGSDEEEGSESEEDDGAVTPSSPALSWSGRCDEGAGGQKRNSTSGDKTLPGGGRHTISAAYEKTGHYARPNITNFSFEQPSKSRSGSTDGGESRLLYPNQSLPPPAYANLSNLAKTAERKYSISSTGGPPATSASEPPNPFKMPALPPKQPLRKDSVSSTDGRQYGVPCIGGRPEQPTLEPSHYQNLQQRHDQLDIELSQELDKMLEEVNAIASFTGDEVFTPKQPQVSHYEFEYPPPPPMSNNLFSIEERDSSFSSSSLPSVPCTPQGDPVGFFQNSVEPTQHNHHNHGQRQVIHSSAGIKLQYSNLYVLTDNQGGGHMSTSQHTDPNPMTASRTSLMSMETIGRQTPQANVFFSDYSHGGSHQALHNSSMTSSSTNLNNNNENRPHTKQKPPPPRRLSSQMDPAEFESLTRYGSLPRNYKKSSTTPDKHHTEKSSASKPPVIPPTVTRSPPGRSSTFYGRTASIGSSIGNLPIPIKPPMIPPKPDPSKMRSPSLSIYNRPQIDSGPPQPIYSRPQLDPTPPSAQTMSTFGAQPPRIYASPLTLDQQKQLIQKDMQQKVGSVGEYVSPNFMAQLTSQLALRQQSAPSPPAPSSPDLPLPPPPEELLISQASYSPYLATYATPTTLPNTNCRPY